MPQLFCSPFGESAPLRLRSWRLVVVGVAILGLFQIFAATPVSANPLKTFFSIFEKKEKPRRAPAPVIIQPRQQVLPRGRRVVNPFIGPGFATPQQSAVPKPKTFNTGRRTMCVRLCDGYYWPMKRGGSNNSLMSDSQKCETQCSSKARLFVLRSSTDNIAGMRDLSGKTYKSLKNAFAYRKSYNPSCRCKAAPWSDRARLRHKRYAAVGKERRVLAIRAIRMDLRSTIKPGADTKIALAETATVSARFWDPVLPSRKPGRLASLTIKHENSVGQLVETSGKDLSAAATAQERQTTVEGMTPGQMQSRIGAMRSDVRVLSFRDLGARVPFTSRIPARRTQSQIGRMPLQRSSALPVGQQLRPRVQ